MSRVGIVCWIGVSTRLNVYLFDMCYLGPPAIRQGLAKVFGDEDILKVVHDCRFMSDALLHQYKVRMVNVFDTQVRKS